MRFQSDVVGRWAVAVVTVLALISCTSQGRVVETQGLPDSADTTVGFSETTDTGSESEDTLTPAEDTEPSEETVQTEDTVVAVDTVEPVPDTAVPPEGSEGGPCTADGICDAPLVCKVGVCVSCEIGSDGCACYGNGTCNRGLICDDELLCASCPEGSEGCACYANNTCDTGLGCAEGSCVSCASACDGLSCGESGGCDCGSCTPDETCESGACVAKSCDVLCQDVDCGAYKGCDCGGCTGNNTCSNNVCVPPDCAALCAGVDCGSVDGCNCGSCAACESCLGGQCEMVGECCTNAECDDQNICTVDYCEGGVCKSTNAADGVGCGGGKTCLDGDCVVGCSCTPADTKCVGSAVQVCSADCKTWQTSELCDCGCAAGACGAPGPADGADSCIYDVVGNDVVTGAATLPTLSDASDGTTLCGLTSKVLDVDYYAVPVTDNFPWGISDVSVTVSPPSGANIDICVHFVPGPATTLAITACKQGTLTTIGGHASCCSSVVGPDTVSFDIPGIGGGNNGTLVVRLVTTDTEPACGPYELTVGF